MADLNKLMQDAPQHFAKGEYAAAADCFSQLIDSGMLADATPCYLNKGVALNALGKFDEALGCFDKVLEMQPGHPQALQYTVQVYSSQGKFKKAIKKIDEMLGVDSKHMGNHELKCNFCNMTKDYEGTLEACDAAMDVEPNNLKVHSEQLLAQVNLAADEANDLGCDIKISCDWFEDQGYVKYDEKKHKLVGTKFGPADEAHSKKMLGTALMQVGTWLNTTKDKKLAIEYYNKSLACHETAVAYYNRGVTYNQIKKRSKALKSFEKAVKKDPRMTVCFSMIGMIYLMQKKYFKSMHAYEKLPEQTKASLYNYGVACFKVARRVDAKSKFEQALKIDPDFTHAKEALAMLQKVWSESDKKVESAAPEGDEPDPPAAVEDRKYNTISLADLRAKKNIPKNFDFCHKEKYLSDADFEKAFGMKQDKFYKLQKWKQNKHKKKAGLF